MIGDTDTVLAYYCFVNFGWEPSKLDALSLREKVLISIFIQEEIESRKKREGK